MADEPVRPANPWIVAGTYQPGIGKGPGLRLWATTDAR